MNVGDLVSFHSDFFSSSADQYSSPGLIIECDDSHRQVRYTVLWSDGKITNEHSGFLKVEKRHENR